MTQLSIIIPTLNESAHVLALVKRIDDTCRTAGITYEMVVIDDHSSDDTLALVNKLKSKHPIVGMLKQGKPGKAYSILEGVAKARYGLIAVIDADLQYSPESLVEMLAQVEAGADVVLAERQSRHPSLLRQISTWLHRKLFVQMMHGLSFDVQSGLKLFRKKVINRLPLQPEAWSFDLEFVLKAVQAGYDVRSVYVPFVARPKTPRRRSAFQPFHMALQLMKASVYHKTTRPTVFPFSNEQTTLMGKGFHYKGKQFITHTDLEPGKSALYRVYDWHILFLIGLCIVLVLGILINWHLTLLIFFSTITVLYFADLFFNLYLILKSFAKAPEIIISDAEITGAKDIEWPSYTIFCPLYKEPEVIPQFITAMSKLNYPKDKLQVMLLLEEDDQGTIESAKHMDLPSYFEIRVVPPSLPKTKPKACNYGLLHATGEYVVIYDAEDVPDPDQLKKAVLAFRKSDRKVVCVQAKLNFYNPHQNLLTRVFTAEYSLWFDLVLTGIQSINAPIPLGGTSNHFRLADLQKLNGWDAFNVTEDCDLGMRLVKNGYRTAILDSTTLEEANSDLKNWFWQRSRWIKGYMQSYLVHMRDPYAFFSTWQYPHAITFQLIVGGKVLSMLVNPIMWATTIAYFVFRPQIGSLVESLFPTAIFYMGIFSLLFGNFLYLYYYMIGCAKRGHDELIKYAVLVPLYWLGMSLAAYMAVYKLITAPHHWSKTKHGLHLNNKKAVAQSEEKIGRGMIDDSLVQRIAAS